MAEITYAIFTEIIKKTLTCQMKDGEKVELKPSHYPGHMK